MAFEMNTAPRTPDEDRRTGLDPGDWPEPTGRGRTLLTVLGVGVLAAVGTMVVVGGSSRTPTDASVAQIVEAPAAFDSDRVTGDGEVDELLTDRALVVQGQQPEDELLLVIRRTAYIDTYPMSATIPMDIAGIVSDGADVRFTGIVDEFDQEQMTDELGIVLHHGLFERWEGEPSIVVDRLELATQAPSGA